MAGFNLSKKTELGMLEEKIKHLEISKIGACKKFRQQLSRKAILKVSNKLLRLKHENIVKFRGYSIRPSAIIFEYCSVKLPGQEDRFMHNLRELINEFNDHDYFCFDERLQYCLQAAQGLNYLHEENVNHMDIKPLNMLVNGTIKNITVKLTDINEMASLKDTCNATITNHHPCIGTTLAYVAPELVSGTVPQKTKESDIYSFGISMFEIFSDKESPWEGVTPTELLKDTIISGQRPQIECVNDLYSKATVTLAIKLVKRCWNSSSSVRPTSLELTETIASLISPKEPRVTPVAVISKNNTKEDSSKRSLRSGFIHDQNDISEVINSCDKESFFKYRINDILNYGVFSTIDIAPRKPLLQYCGDLITAKEGEKREKKYKAEHGSFIFFFNYKGKDYCIDATNNNLDRLCRYVNDSPKGKANCVMKITEYKGNPHLVLYSKQHIPLLNELRYDYDTHGNTNLWWRKQHATFNYPTTISKENFEHYISVISSTKDQKYILTVSQGSTSHQDDDCAKKAKKPPISFYSTPKDDDCTKPVFEQTLPSNKNLSPATESVPETEMVLELLSPLPDCLNSRENTATSSPRRQSIKNEENWGVSLKPYGYRIQKVVEDSEGEKEVSVSRLNEMTNLPLLESVDDIKIENIHKEIEEKIDFQLDWLLQMEKNINKPEEVSKEPNTNKHEDGHNEQSINNPEDEPIDQLPITNDSGLLLDVDEDVIDTDSNYDDDLVLDEETDQAENDENEQVEDSGESNESQTKTNKNKQPKKSDGNKENVVKKPYRCCPFCNAFKSKLNDHIIKMHKDEKAVKEALLKPRNERIAAFSLFRKEGIKNFNLEELKKENPKLERERKGKATNMDTLKMCAKCSGFFEAKYINRHNKGCQINSTTNVLSLPVTLIRPIESVRVTDDFKENILAKFRSDATGKMCQTDPTIITIGLRLYDKMKRKMDKVTEVRKSVRTDMRRLGHLYSHFQVQPDIHTTNNNAMDMFNRLNFNQLSDAIGIYTEDEDRNVKSGLKISLIYLIKTAALVMKGAILATSGSNGLSSEENSKKALAAVTEVDHFISVFEYMKDFIFGDASYTLNKQRQIKLRKPTSLPVEEDIKTLKEFVVKKIKEIAGDKLSFMDNHRYVELRDATCTRLTLFNGRRGGEPARLLLGDWENAVSREWTTNQRKNDLDDMERRLVDILEVTFMTGKGNNHLVPLIFPPDTIEALKILVDTSIRAQVDIHPKNKYVFPSLGNSENHVSGWHAVNKMCIEIKDRLENIKTLTATSNRHRVSTLFAMTDLPQQDREWFYKHMGHSKAINECRYQAPPAIMELTKVAKHLVDMDGGLEETDDSNGSINNDKPGCSQDTSKSDDKPGCKKHVAGNSEIKPGCSKGITVQTFKKSYTLRRREAKTQRELDNDSDSSSSGGDDHDYEYKLREDQDNNIDEDSAEESDHVLDNNQLKRKSFRWNDNLVEKFNKRFRCYVDKTAKIPMPTQQEMKAFLDENGSCTSYTVVRTRINNERKKRNEMKKKRLSSLTNY